MGVQDLWVRKDGTPTARYGRGLRYRVNAPGHPARAFDTEKRAITYYGKLLAAEPKRPIDMITVGELCPVWLATKKGLSKKGYEACRVASAHVRERWGSVLVSEVHRHEVEAWLGSLDGGTSLRAKALQALSGMMRIAVARHGLPANPCQGLSVRQEKEHQPRFLTPAELRDLAGRFGDDEPLVLLLGMTGMRISEAISLDVGNVDKARGRIWVGKTKTRRPREVPVPRTVLDMLDLDRPQSDPLFTGMRGRRLDKRTFQRRWVTVVGKTTLGDVWIHDLRHTAASLMIASGADVKKVQASLGHATAAMTMDLYGHLLDAGLDDVSARMDTLLGYKSGTTSSDTGGIAPSRKLYPVRRQRPSTALTSRRRTARKGRGTSSD